MLASTTTKGLRSFTQSVSSQVRNLMQDPSLVARRTHIAKNSDHSVLCSFAKKSKVQMDDGNAADEENVERNFLEEEYDCETYEDAEFYQQILKEFLESQSLTSGDIARAKKVKRRKLVDRKASKGRKIRYHVHEKLVNFMVPCNFDTDDANMYNRTLFASLFQ